MVRPVGSEFLVNDKVVLGESESVAVALPDGGFAVAWRDVRTNLTDPEDGGLPFGLGDQVRARAFQASGSALAQSTVISSEEPSDESLYDLAGGILDTGDLAFAWRSNSTDVYAEEARTLSPDLTPKTGVVGHPFGGSSAPRQGLDLVATTGATFLLGLIADDSSRIQVITGESRTFSETEVREPRAFSLVDRTGDGAAIVYYGPIITDDGSPDTLNFRPLNGSGEAVAVAHEIPWSYGPIRSIDTALLENGNIVVVLTTDVDRALILDDDGEVVLPPFEMASDDVAALADGGFVTSWNGGVSGVLAQAYADDGVALGPPMRAGFGFDPDVVGLSNGDFAVSWAVYGNINARIFSLEGIDRPQGTVESTGGYDALRGTPGQDVFFFDTKRGEQLGNDTVINFAPGDLIVTTSPFVDENGDGRIKANSSDRLALPGDSEALDSSTGTLKVFYQGTGVLSTLVALGVQAHEGASYYVYGRVTDGGGQHELLF